jgi:hypothetical protein
LDFRVTVASPLYPETQADVRAGRPAQDQKDETTEVDSNRWSDARGLSVELPPVAECFTQGKPTGAGEKTENWKTEGSPKIGENIRGGSVNPIMNASGFFVRRNEYCPGSGND